MNGLKIKCVKWAISEMYEESTGILYIGTNFDKTIEELASAMEAVREAKDIGKNIRECNRGRRVC